MKTLLICCFLMLPFSSWASHMMGAEISYKWLGNKKYEVTVKVYRDCRGISLNSPVINISDYNGTTIALSYNRTSIEDISLRCSDTIPKPCNPSNTTVSEGIELHTFVSTVDFSTSPFNTFVNNSVCLVYFSVEQCCRNGAITTLNQGNLYVDAMLDLCKSQFRNTSPQFKSLNVLTALCNQPFKQNFGSKDFVDFDSLAYELVTPLNAAQTNETYQNSFSSSIPMTPYCATSGVINCTPIPNAKPPRGFYFNKLTGDVVFTPVNCSEVGVIALKVSEYRRDSSNNKWLLVGYVIRDIQIGVVVGSGNNYPPTASLNSTYNFRTRQNLCIDIKSSDTAAPGSSSSNKGDKTYMTIKELPAGATFGYVDSSARNKTGRLCWNVHDSVYIKFKNKNKLLPLTLEIRDNYCPVPTVVQQSFSIHLLPPDSSGFLSINSFLDPDKNNIKDSTEPALPVLLKFKDKSSSYYVETDDKGVIEDSVGTGTINIGVANHPYFESTGGDTALLVKFDSAHHLNFGIHQRSGIYGRLYRDVNSNCNYDKGEVLYSGYKVHTDSNKYTGISDQNGIYFINAPKGNYQLTCNYKPAEYSVSCPSSKSINISINGDSAYMGNDFGISKNMQYTDISTGIGIGRLRRGNVGTVTLYCFNNGPTTRKNIKLYCPVSSNFDLTYNSSLYANAGTTATIQIDSILPYKTFTIKLDFYISTTTYKVGDKICFNTYTDSLTMANDSLKNNNSIMECRVVDAPYDPNEKLVAIDSAKTTLDQAISYTIHFQNNGTDTAVRIVVIDTIDTRYLELDKFQLNWSDYPCQPVISGNVLHFIFDNINLPYFSKSGDRSMAGFNFSLGLKSKVPQETSFNNNAAIYFDFEEPVFTKNAITTINSPIAVKNIFPVNLCKNETGKLIYRSKVVFNPGNQIILELSDANGSFLAPVTLNTLHTTSIEDSIYFNVPKTFNPANYILRLRSTDPPSVSIPGSGYFTFNALETPAYLINSNLNNNKACEKDTLKISFSGKNFQYQILKNNQLFQNFDTIRSFGIVLKSKDSFKIIAKDKQTKCMDTVAIDPVIYPQPSVSANILNRKKAYCSGEQMDIKATGGLYYVYTNTGGILANKTVDSIFRTPLDMTETFRVIGEDGNGCTNQSDTLNITVNPSPVATISHYPDPVCIGDTSVTLTFGSALHYDLYKNNILVLNKTTLNSYKVAFLTGGDKFKITAYAANGCYTNSKELSIVVNPVPDKPFINKAGNDLSVNVSGNVKWYRNGVLLSQTGNSISNAPGGIYRVIITNTEGCSNSSDVLLHKNSSIALSTTDVFKLYPNPASQQLNIMNLSSVLPYSATIFDMNGRMVYQSEKNYSDHLILDLNDLTAGLYILRIESGMGTFHSATISVVK